MNRLILITIAIVSMSFAYGYNLECYSFPNANQPLDVPTYISGNVETCHPDVLHFPQGWNGWNYWMSHTPYPNTDVQYENPSLVVSNNGIDWVEPEGLTNPIADLYQGTDWYNNYNSDSHLYMSEDNSTMYMIWRRKNGWSNELIKQSSSTDGINWSAPEVILSVFSTNPVLNESAICPCMVYNGHSYMLWTVNTKVNPRSVYLRIKQPWSDSFSEPILTNIGEFPEGYRLWHMDVEYFDGYYHMLASVGSPTDQDGRVLYLGKSLDGINWTFSSAPVMLGRQNFWDALIYRSALLPEYREGVLEYRNWYGSMNTPQWRIGYTESETSGYLASPQDYQVIHTYDGQNHFQLSWDAPNQIVTGYKVYLNYQEYTILEPGVTSIAFTAHEGAPHIGLVTFAVFAIYPDGESDPVTSFHDLALGTSDEHNPQPQNLRLYPNPFNDHLIVDAQLKGSYSRIDLFNLKGQLVFSRPIDNAFTGRIDLEKTLRSGIYFYRLSGAKQVHSGRLLKL